MIKKLFFIFNNKSCVQRIPAITDGYELFSIITGSLSAVSSPTSVMPESSPLAPEDSPSAPEDSPLVPEGSPPVLLPSATKESVSPSLSSLSVNCKMKGEREGEREK